MLRLCQMRLDISRNEHAYIRRRSTAIGDTRIFQQIRSFRKLLIGICNRWVWISNGLGISFTTVLVVPAGKLIQRSRQVTSGGWLKIVEVGVLKGVTEGVQGCPASGADQLKATSEKEKKKCSVQVGEKKFISSKWRERSENSAHGRQICSYATACLPTNKLQVSPLPLIIQRVHLPLSKNKVFSKILNIMEYDIFFCI